jgi:hypothetical protein
MAGLQFAELRLKIVPLGRRRDVVVVRRERFPLKKRDAAAHRSRECSCMLVTFCLPPKPREYYAHPIGLD